MLTGGKTPGKHDVVRAAKARLPLLAGLNWSREPRDVRERQRVAVPRVVHDPRIEDRHLPVVAVEVRDRHVEVEPAVLRNERLDAVRLAAAGVHPLERLEQPARHGVAAER